MRPSELVFYRLPVGWRWLVESVWKLEHAFERAKADGKAEDDTRIRIFFILALFAAGFVTLALGATKCAIFSDADRAEVAAVPPSGSRADLVDRQGNLLAVDLTHYGLYVDSREIWDANETRRVLGAALPGLQPGRLEHALAADKREYLYGGLTPEQKAHIEDMGLPGVSFEEEERRVYPLGPTAAHLIGFADKGGVGLSGAEHAFDAVIRDRRASPRLSLCPWTCACRRRLTTSCRRPRSSSACPTQWASSPTSTPAKCWRFQAGPALIPTIPARRPTTT